jgi:acid phosphatase type 7
MYSYHQCRLFLLLLLFVSHSTKAYKNSSTSPAVNLCESQRHIHLSTGRDASNSITISFSSYPCDDRNLQESELNYRPGGVLIGTDPEKLELILGKDVRMYQANIHHPDEHVELYTSERQHHIMIENLTESTKYYYKCVVLIESHLGDTKMSKGTNDEDDDESQERAFEQRYLRRMSLPTHFSEDESVLKTFTTASKPLPFSRAKFAILGDLGVAPWQPHSKNTLAQLSNHLIDLNYVIIAGDITYANGNHKKWDDFFDALPSGMMETPLYVVAGNHDAEGDHDTGEIFTAFENRFRMPHIAPTIKDKAKEKHDFDLNLMYQLPYDYGNSYYAFQYGPSYNIALNAFADFEPGSLQYQWLETELNTVNRDISPWLVVIVHCPMYNTFSFHKTDPQPVNLKLYLEPLFVEYRVNVVLSGHLHGYSRSHPIAFEQKKDSGPIHFVLGNGGRTINAPFQNQVKEDWVAVRDHTTYGFGIIEYLNATTAKYEWIHSGFNAPEETEFQDIPANFTDLMYIQNQWYL